VELIDVDEERIVLVMRRNPDSERSYAEMGVPEAMTRAPTGSPSATAR